MLTETRPGFDPERVDTEAAECFANDLMESLNRSAVVLMISMGHRAGLFDAMAGQPSMTSEEIANAARLEERYVREWLAVMVTGRVVLLDAMADAGNESGKASEAKSSEQRYVLPDEHAAFLCRDASPNNLAAIAQFIPVLAAVESDVLNCFRFGGGVPYERFERFHEVMAEDSAQTVLPVLLSDILPMQAGLIERLQSGIRVLDAGCGQGRALTLMAEAFPNSEFYGYDLCFDTVATGRRLAAENGVTNVTFEQYDVAQLQMIERFDLITAFDAIHDQARPQRVLDNIFRALKPDGLFLMQDIAASTELSRNMDHPIGPLLYTISCMHCMTVSLAQCGCGLGACWGEELASEMLKTSGFSNVRIEQLPHDIQNQFYLCQKEQ